MLVVGIQLADVFNKLLDWNSFHVICGEEQERAHENGLRTPNQSSKRKDFGYQLKGVVQN